MIRYLVPQPDHIFDDTYHLRCSKANYKNTVENTVIHDCLYDISATIFVHDSGITYLVKAKTI
jgi:hypothetical protein